MSQPIFLRNHEHFKQIKAIKIANSILNERLLKIQSSSKFKGNRNCHQVINDKFISEYAQVKLEAERFQINQMRQSIMKSKQQRIKVSKSLPYLGLKEPNPLTVERKALNQINRLYLPLEAIEPIAAKSKRVVLP